MTLDVELQLRQNLDGEIGEVIEDRIIFFGERFFVEILVGDFRDSPQGIISVDLQIDFQSDIIVNVNDPFNPNELITEELPIIPTGQVDNEIGLISNFGASSLPIGSNTGSAIGINEFERFAVLEFEAVGATESSTIEVEVDLEQTGFADGTFPAADTPSEFSIDFLVGALAIDDTTFFTSEGVANARKVGTMNVRSPNPENLKFEIIAGNEDTDNDNIPAFLIQDNGNILVFDRDELTQNFTLEIKSNDVSLGLEDTATVEIEVTPLPFLGSLENDSIENTENKEIAFLGKGEDEVNSNSNPSPTRLYGGTDDDILIANNNDRVFGSLGNDRLTVNPNGSNNRLYGGVGNDEFFFNGNNNFLAGGNGIDRFFPGDEGGNTIRGGSDPDFFYLTNGVLPNTPNIIQDFTLEEDIIGLAGLGEEIAKSELEITVRDNDTIITFNQEIAILKGIEIDTPEEIESIAFISQAEAFS